MPAAGHLLDMFVPLKSYFESQEKCPMVIQQCFCNPLAEVWLVFAHSMAETFHSTVLQIEGQKVTTVQVFKALNNLKARLNAQNNAFLPQKVKERLRALEDESSVNLSDFQHSVIEYYLASIAYLDQCCSHLDYMKLFEWTLDNSGEFTNME